MIVNSFCVGGGVSVCVWISVPFKVSELGPILPNLTKLEGFLHQNH